MNPVTKTCYVYKVALNFITARQLTNCKISGQIDR